jgi:hypothetical protein
MAAERSDPLVTINEAPVTVTTPERQTIIRNDVDARTEIADGAIRNDVDATTALTEDSIRVDVRGGPDADLRQVMAEQTEAIAELRAEISKPKPLVRKRVSTDEIGRITEITEEVVD